MANEITLRAHRACAEWLKECLRLGWGRDQLDALEALWWEHHDERGNLKPNAGVAPSREPSRDQLTAMVDAAMVEMSNIHPPLRRSECERLIRAALGVTPSGPSELEMLRADHQAVQAAGFHDTGELLSAYKRLVESVEDYTTQRDAAGVQASQPPSDRDTIKAEVSRIEDLVAAGDLKAAATFTRMRELLNRALSLGMGVLTNPAAPWQTAPGAPQVQHEDTSAGEGGLPHG